MIAWAADYWPIWTKRKGDRLEWIAKRVNERVERQPVGWRTVSKKWVNQRKGEIEAEVIRRSDATRKN
jgi:hypothetical protein